MLKKVAVLLVGVILTAGCASGLSEAEVDSRIASAVATAVAEIPPAQSYEIVDPETALVRATLSLDEDGSVSLKLLDPEGVARVGLVLWPDDIAALVLADTEGVSRIGLTVPPEGQPKLLFQDALGNIIASYP